MSKVDLKINLLSFVNPQFCNVTEHKVGLIVRYHIASLPLSFIGPTRERYYILLGLIIEHFYISTYVTAFIARFRPELDRKSNRL